MEPHLILAWSLFAVYFVGTFALAYLGYKRTQNFAEFAVGKRDMGPGLAGMTLGACLASTATFVINPGFVYQWGLPALIALSIPLILGVFAGLAALGPGFRKHGATATTLPGWIAERYQSPGLRAWFAFLCLLQAFYIIMIVFGAAKVMQFSMGVSYPWAVAIVVCVVFSYVFLGGTYAHAYTNTAQGAIMLVVALVITGYALHDLGDLSTLRERLAAQGPNLANLTDPDSPFYRNWFEVLVAPFFLGFALTAQPHLLLKTLYLKRTQDLAKFAIVGGGCFVVFSLLLLGGLAARMSAGDTLDMNTAMPAWLAGTMNPYVGAVVSVAIIAAAMSTLDGLLVAISSIVGGDLAAHPGLTRRLGIDDEDRRNRLALNAGRVTIIALGAVAWIVALNPPAIVGIFGTIGTFGLIAASVPPILFGVLLKRPPKAAGIALASVVALGIHLFLYYGGYTINTTLTASAGMLASLPLAFVFGRVPADSPVNLETTAEGTPNEEQTTPQDDAKSDEKSEEAVATA